MKKLLILILTICSIAGFGQTILNPSGSNSVANINNAISIAPAASGTDTYTITIIGATLTTNKGYTITFTNANTGTSTLNINDGSNNLGAVTLKKYSSGSLVNLASGDISAGQPIRFQYNGTNFVMVGGSSSGSGGGTWGSITGTLSSQTDLQSALNALQPQLSGTGFVKAIGTTISYDNSTYLTANQSITLSGAVTGSGTTTITTTIATPGTLTVSSTNSNATAHTHAITSSSAPGSTASILATDASGIIGSTGTRITKGWFTDLTVTNAIAGSVTGNAATVTTNANLTGPITSSGNTTSIASQTGTGTTFAMSAGPTFTGNPIVPTQTAGDNSTKIASTAYVATALTNAALPAADATHDGYLTQTDWSTFNTSATGVRPANLGGTGLSTFAVGDLIYASSTTPTLSRLAGVATGNSLLSGATPSWGKITSSHIDATVQTAGLSFLLASGGAASSPITFTGTSTNIYNYSFAGLGTTITDGAGAYYKNPTAAAAGAQQISPIITLEGNGWKTNATAGSQPVAWQIYNSPVQAAAAPTTSLIFQSRINGADGVGKLTLKSDGAILASESTGLTVRANSLAAGGVSFTGTAPSSNELFVANTGFSIRNSATISTAIAAMTFNMGGFTTTSGSSRFLELISSYSPTSGTGTFAYVTMPTTSIINQTGGANGDISIFNLTPVYTAAGGNVSLLDYNPTVTSITGSHYGLRIRPAASLNGFGLGATAPSATLHVVGSMKFDGTVTLPTAGNGILIKEGTNATMGSATLSTGTVTISTTKVTANSRIILTSQVDGGTVGFLRVSTRTAGTSFVVTSSSALDTSTIAWVILEPAP